MSRTSNSIAVAVAAAFGLAGHAIAQSSTSSDAEVKARTAAEGARQDPRATDRHAGTTAHDPHASAAEAQQIGHAVTDTDDAVPGSSPAAGDSAPEGTAAAQARQSPASPPPPEPRSPRTAVTGRTTIMDGQTPVTITSHHPTATKGKHTVDFAGLDTNGDGWLSRAEADPNATLRMGYPAADRDGDGRLTREEFDSWTPDGH